MTKCWWLLIRQFYFENTHNINVNFLKRKFSQHFKSNICIWIEKIWNSICQNNHDYCWFDRIMFLFFHSLGIFSSYYNKHSFCKFKKSKYCFKTFMVLTLRGKVNEDKRAETENMRPRDGLAGNILQTGL